MASASGSRWKRLVLPVLVTGLCGWLAYGAIATGMAGFHENRGDGGRALRWRATSPAALALEAERLAQEQNHVAADAAARRALKRSSLQANAMRVLALSASARARPDEALALMGRAGHLDPRDGAALGWLFERALARGDHRRAILYADNLMRRSPQTQNLLSSALTALLKEQEARATLVERLSIGPPWRGTFLSFAARKGAAADVAALFQALEHTSSPTTDGEAYVFFSRLVAEGKYREAKRYFDALVGRPNQVAALVYNGAFAGQPGPPPLNWQTFSVAGGEAHWRLGDGGPMGSLRVSHDGFSSSSPLVGQLILLTSGSYEVTARSRVNDPAAAGRFSLQITCVTGPRLVSASLRGTPGQWTPLKAGFVVPTEACEAQWLYITPVTGDRREVAEMFIDDIVVRRADPGRARFDQPDWNR